MITVAFPLLQIGNTQSFKNPRRVSGLRINDFIEAVWMLLNVAIASIPYLLFVELFGVEALCVLYGIITMVVWWRMSIVKTAENLNKNAIELCGAA
jgi:uncharacterized membrane protein